MKYKQYIFFFFFVIFGFQFSFGQESVSDFLKPSDILDIKRQNTVIIAESILATGALVGLNQLWYADYPRSDFHFINDNSEWLQMDKVGHFYSAYHLGRFGVEMLDWSGATKKKQLIYGAGLGFAFLSAVEVMDGFSSEWGASVTDVITNASGTALYVSQEIIWKEQRIIPKFSFHKTHFAAIRPNVLGNSTAQQILKDYNGQTYWLSVNLHSFFKTSKIPRWFNIAIGYGGEGMLYGSSENSDLILDSKPERFRQFYMSFDIDLTKIETQSPFLKTFFTVFNTIKIPAPTLEYTANEGFRVHALYF